jgi:hypothetical protein
VRWPRSWARRWSFPSDAEPSLVLDVAARVCYFEYVQARAGTYNVVHLALASAGALMLTVAYLRWIGMFDVLGAMSQ